MLSLQSKVLRSLGTRNAVAVLGSGLGLELGGISVNGMTCSQPSFFAH